MTIGSGPLHNIPEDYNLAIKLGVKPRTTFEFFKSQLFPNIIKYDMNKIDDIMRHLVKKYDHRYITNCICGSLLILLF
jgi:hypothetical protein